MPRKMTGGMRGMKNRQLGREKRTGDAATPKDAAGGDMPELDDEHEEPIDEGVLVDQGDGTRVLRRGFRRGPQDQESHECPDEPPEGWGEG